MVRRFLRETSFRATRRELALFLQDHEEELMAAFRQELIELDNQMPEEAIYIDIKMVPLGEAMLKAGMRALQRFLIQ